MSLVLMRGPSTIALAALALSAYAQAPVFDAASIKPTRSENGARSLTHNPGGRLNASNATLKMLILLAYQVMPYQLSGGPGWLDSDGFDIDAKSAPGATPAQFRQMVQALLADRFQLRVHQETKELPIYLLVVGKHGSKLAHSQDTAEASMGIQGAGRMTGVNATMPMFAGALTKALRQKVADGTGLTGAYSFQLEYAPQDDGSPSIFTALEEQLGLGLKPSRGPVEILVIDRAARPSAN